MEKYLLLVKFIGDNFRLPKAKEEYSNINLGAWLDTNRQNFKKNKLSKEQLDKLDELEPWTDWVEKKGGKVSKPIVSWETKYNILVEFSEEYGRFPKALEEYSNMKIGSWVHGNKTNFKKNKLLKEQLDKLDELEPWTDWVEKEGGKVTKPIVSWETKYNILVEFTEEYVRFPKVKEEYSNMKIGVWLDKNRQKFKKNKLSKEQLDKLDELKPWTDWVEKKGGKVSKPIVSWETKYNILVEFSEEYVRFPTRKEEYSNMKIGIWLDTNRQNFKNNKLSQERIDKLSKLEPWNEWTSSL